MSGGGVPPLAEMCRCCLRADSKLTETSFDISSNVWNSHINKMMYSFPDLQIAEYNNFRLCDKCTDTLNGAYYFKRATEAANSVFKEYLRELYNAKQSSARTNESYTKSDTAAPSQPPQISTNRQNVPPPYSNNVPVWDNAEDIVKVEMDDETEHHQDYVGIKLETYADHEEQQEWCVNVDDTSTSKSMDENCANVNETDDVGHRCEHCNKSFGNKPHKCKYCDESFAFKGCLGGHMAMHPGKKLYQCEYCKEILPNKSNLTLHLRKHTGERPYRCTECNKSFARSFVLKQHSRIHTGEKPYKCDHCDKTFGLKGNLKMHSIRYHGGGGGGKPYKCKDCDKSFERNDQLLTHTCAGYPA